MAESNKVTLTIDGHEVSVPKGTTLLQAAQEVGKSVPHYCYHPGMSSPAMCRLCLVEVEGAPKPMPSCVTQAQDGQVVHTESELALDMRQGVLEFYLVNHPLDCPICDQSGECKLQDYVHQEGRDHGRSREPKRVFGRDDFGGDVLFYGDRCVMCTRCVRFMNEVEQDPRLTVVERGNRSVIDTFFDEGLEGTNWSGNIVDICPVGALVSKDFLHKQRAWDLDHTPSVCPSCSQGCNIELHTRDNLVQRLKPRTNLDVNAYWMCDHGRANYEFINRGGRMEAPLVKNADRAGDSPVSGTVEADGTLEDPMERGVMDATRAADDAGTPSHTAMGWKQALTVLVGRVEALRTDSGSPLDVRAVASPRAANEDLAALRAVVDALGGGEMVYRMARAEDEIPLKGMPSLARRRELAPNGTGADLLGFSRVGGDDATGGLDDVSGHGGVVIVLGDELADQAAEFAGKADLFVYLGTHTSPAVSGADFLLPVTSFAEQEGTFTNRDRRVQRFWPGLQAPGAARPAWLILGALAAELGEAAPASSAADAFRLFVATHDAFAGLDYDAVGTRGAVLNETVELAGD